MNRRAVSVGVTALASFGLAALVSPAVGSATECGLGTVFDAPSNTCIAAALPPLPPPPPPDLTPYFSVGICAPIPFVSLCTGI